MSDATTALAAAQAAAASASGAADAEAGAAESVATALTHRNAAQTARTGAETARDDAQTAASTAATDALAAVTPANDVAITAVDSNAASAFRVQQDARLLNTFARLTFIDAEGYKTGANTDLQAIEAACAAATALSSGYACVRLSPRTWDVGTGLAMSGYRCGLVGTGSAQNGAAYKGTVLHATAQTGPVLDITGLLTPAFGRMPIGGFTLKGDDTADATKAKKGLAQTSGTALSGLHIFDITVAETGGPGVELWLLYLSTVERIVVRTPVAAKANDVAYIKLVACSGTTFDDLGCRSTLTAADVGVSGAIVITDDGIHAGDSCYFGLAWFENLHVPTNGSLVKCAANNYVFEKLYLPDSGKEAAATGTSVIQFLAPSVEDSGGNTLLGTIPGTNVGSWDTGVKVSQNGNRIVGIKGYQGGNVTLDSGVTRTYAELGGSISGATGTAFTDNSGTTGNVLLDHVNRYYKRGAAITDEVGGWPRIADGSGNGRHYFGTSGFNLQAIGANTYLNLPGFLYFRDTGSGVKFTVRADGFPYIQLGDTVTLSTAAAAYRGAIAYKQGAAGTADRMVTCRKDKADNYAWVDMFNLTGSATLDFPSVAAAGSQELTITVSGAAVGDTVVLGAPAAIEAGLVWNGYVSAADTVKVRVSNITGSAIDPVSATWKATIVR